MNYNYDIEMETFYFAETINTDIEKTLKNSCFHYKKDRDGYAITGLKVGGKKQLVINIPYGVTRISKNAFRNCKMIEVNIPSTVKDIDDYAFEWCDNLIRVNLSQGLLRIGNFGFGFCRNLVYINLPKSLLVLENFAFSGCDKLESLDISHVSKIGFEAVSKKRDI